MGIAFVLLFWLILGGCIAAVASALAMGLVLLLTRRALSLRRRAVVVAAVFPFLTLAYAFTAFITYASLSEARGFDAALGDTWRLPLGHGASLVMIDIPEQAFVTTHDSAQHCFALTSMASNGRVLFGTQSADPSFFSLDLATGTEHSFPDQQAFRSAAAACGLQPQDLLPPGDYYSRHRWHAFDQLFLAGAASVPTLTALVLVAALVRRVRRERA